MNFGILKEAVYISEALFGIFLLVLAYYGLKAVVVENDALYNLIPAFALLIAGIACCGLGLATYFLREDPET